MKRRIGTHDHHGRRPTKHAIQLGPIETLESRTLLSVSPLARIVNGHVVDDQGIVNGTQTSGFEAVGEVGDRSGPYCTGTLISTRFVLTAGHCAQGVRDTQGRFTLDGSTYATSRVYVHPNYNGNRIGYSDAANDIALFQLSVSVAGITPDPIYRGIPQVGNLLTLVGFGAAGSGSRGHDGSFGVKRAGTTPIDELTQRRVLWTFDNNRESNTAPGDSGGPAYLNVGGVYYIAGITSGGDRADAAIGDHSFDTRVDYYAPWIDSIVGTTADLIPSPDLNPDPDSGSDDHADAPGSTATTIAVNGSGSIHASGSLEVTGDRDLFQIHVATAGNLTLDLNAESFDAYVRIYDAAGNLIAFDDDSGPRTNSHFSQIVQPGTYYVAAGSYNDTGTGDYALNGTFSLDDHGDSFAGATPISLGTAGTAVEGTIDQAGDRDLFRFVAGQNGHITVDLRAAGPGLDPVLTVYDARGRVLAVNDDSAGTIDSHVSMRVRAGSTYYVQAAAYRSSHGDYSIQIAPSARVRHGGVRSTIPSEWVAGAQSEAMKIMPAETAQVASSDVSLETLESPEGLSQPTAPHATIQSFSHGDTTSDDADPLDSVIADALCPSLEHFV